MSFFQIIIPYIQNVATQIRHQAPLVLVCGLSQYLPRCRISWTLPSFSMPMRPFPLTNPTDRSSSKSMSMPVVTSEPIITSFGRDWIAMWQMSFNDSPTTTSRHWSFVIPKRRRKTSVIFWSGHTRRANEEPCRTSFEQTAEWPIIMQDWICRIESLSNSSSWIARFEFFVPHRHWRSESIYQRIWWLSKEPCPGEEVAWDTKRLMHQ